MASEWVAAHENDLPRTLSELREYAPAFRLAIIQRLDTPTLSRMWHDQLSAYLNPDSSLTVSQREFVSRILSTREYWENRFIARKAVDRDSVLERANKLFGKDKAGAIFTHLGGPFRAPAGPASASQASLIAAPLALLEAAAVRLGLLEVNPRAAVRRDFCDCSSSGDWCPAGVCTTPSGGCDPLTWGCGIMGWSTCTGQCLAFQ